jgi:hypothetical protein
MPQPDFQPTLIGPTVMIRPVSSYDWPKLFAAGSDPEIWKVHPVPDRHTEPQFRKFFDEAVAGAGARRCRTARAMRRSIASTTAFTTTPASIRCRRVIISCSVTTATTPPTAARCRCGLHPARQPDRPRRSDLLLARPVRMAHRRGSGRRGSAPWCDESRARHALLLFSDLNVKQPAVIATCWLLAMTRSAFPR